MKITVSVQTLLDALRKVANVVSNRSTIPILSNIMLTAEGTTLSLSATDLEVSITTTLEAAVERGGDTTLPAKKLVQIVSALPSGDVTLDTDDAMTTSITCGKASLKIMGMSSSEFPKEGEFQEDRQLELPQSEFGKTLGKIAYSVSNDQTRYVLNGILLSIRDGNFTAVATDGRRLALVEKILDGADTPIDGDAVLPLKVVNELQKLLDGDGSVVIKLSDSRASFIIDQTVLTTKLVEGSYPNYRQVIPAEFNNSVVLPREVFADVLNRVSVVVSDTGASVKFELTENQLSLSASSSDVGEANEPIEIAYESEPVSISFNPAYLKDPLKHLDCDELTMRFNDGYKPVVLLGDEGFLYVIMPMRS